MLHLGACDGIESSDAYDLFYTFPTTVIGVGVGSEHATEKRFHPQGIRSNSFVSPFIDAVTLDPSGYLDFDSHVQSREGIVTTDPGYWKPRQ